MSTTKVNALGFEIKLADNISMGQFFKTLKERADSEITVKPTTHVHYVDTSDGYVVGLILTYKNHRRYMEAKRDDDGSLLVTKLEVEPGANGTEVNVFVLNPETQKGVFFTYFGSISAGRAWRLFHEIHENLRSELVETFVSQSGAASENAKSKKRALARKHYGGKFALDVLISVKDLDDLLAQFSRLSKIEIRAMEGLADAPLLSPLKNFSDSASLDLRLNQNANQSDLKAALRTAFSAINPSTKGKTLRMIGAALTGEELALRLGENRVDYGAHNYDDYVLELPDDRWSNFSNCRAIKRAIDIVKSYKATFGEPSGSHGWLSAKGLTPKA